MMELYPIISEKKGIFLKRLNRFVGIVEIDELCHRVHIHDPGRLKELLYPGNTVLVSSAKNKNRKTRWDLIAARRKGEWVLVHSGFHRRISEILLSRGIVRGLEKIEDIKAEVKIEDGRLDFCVFSQGKKIWIETKGCTLFREGMALFPDAPTKRGTRHLRSLIKLREQGDRTMLLLLIFSPSVECFYPNKDTDPAFFKTFFIAFARGVDIRPISLYYDGTSVYFSREIPLCKRR